jgi:hypothetical protein
MPVGTPIRLVQESHDVIELDATSMVLTTSRKVGGSALPFSGSRRVGFDLNVNSAMINIQGIIVDDQIAKGSEAASMTVNFGSQHGLSDTWATKENIDYLLDANTPAMILKDFNGNERSILFVAGSGLAGGVKALYNSSLNPSKIQIDSSGNFAVDLATAVAAYITGELSSYFTATSVSGLNRNAGTNNADAVQNCAVKIQHVVKGTAPNGTTIRFSRYGGNAARFEIPQTQTFGGGANETKKSAGDKVQDLYGIVNNSKTQAGRAVQAGAAAALGIAGLIVAAPIAAGAGVGAAVTGAATGGTAFAAGAGAAGGFLTNAVLARNKEDYIIGLQIPYNSMLKAEDGTQYSAMNFFMPTGLGHSSSNKGSEGARPAGTKFSHASEDRTGIQGSIQKLDITYDAGETAYNFNIIFAPIDNIL